jgi:hypothetical protein
MLESFSRGWIGVSGQNAVIPGAAEGGGKGIQGPKSVLAGAKRVQA